MECPHCGLENQQGNFCSNCGKKMATDCKYCWLKNKPYSCEFERCPDYGMTILDKMVLRDMEKSAGTRAKTGTKTDLMYIWAMMMNIMALVILGRYILEMLF